jgi:hypothetical protein
MKSLVFVVLTAMVGSASFQGGRVFFCHMDGALHLNTCCKPSAHQPHDRIMGERHSCCDTREIQEFDTPVIPRFQSAEISSPQPVVGYMDVWQVQEMGHHMAPTLAMIRGPPLFGPALFQQNCSFLI